MNVDEKMSIDFLTRTDLNVTGITSISSTSSTSSASAFTPFQRASTSNSEQTSAQSSRIFNPATYVVTIPLQERVTIQEQSAQSKTAEKVSSVLLPLPPVPHSSQPENQNRLQDACADCRKKIIGAWQKNPTNKGLTLLVLPFIYQRHNWIEAQKVCQTALRAHPHSVRLLNEYEYIRAKIRHYYLFITNNRAHVASSR